MNPCFYWIDRPVSFRPGETIAAALLRAGIADLGPDRGAARARVFCGIGACQACVVAVAGEGPVEACLTPARAGLRLGPQPGLGLRHD
ncbi:2Fe-2S iron-sulfur cluster-binding protein [Bosea sp. (in: a-proteobacteria)]|uniref:2Fe-2S iron-sulfur cluster-binding protein n=1 Tax=Bosea sp. (in: a-proteobacteria) TaxID=1871050 RepID=UPI002FCBBC3F